MKKQNHFFPLTPERFYQSRGQPLLIFPPVHLILFWYMPGAIQKFSELYRLKKVQRGLWTHLFAEPLQPDATERAFAITVIPAPGQSIVELLLEELCDQGVIEFYFWGSAARIRQESNRESDAHLYFVHEALSADTTRKISLPNLQYTQMVAGGWLAAKVQTIISPYDFLKEQYEQALAAGIQLIEMESFFVYDKVNRLAVHHKKITACIFLYASDKYDEFGWHQLERKSNQTFAAFIERFRRTILIRERFL